MESAKSTVDAFLIKGCFALEIIWDHLILLPNIIHMCTYLNAMFNIGQYLLLLFKMIHIHAHFILMHHIGQCEGQGFFLLFEIELDKVTASWLSALSLCLAHKQ